MFYTMINLMVPTPYLEKTKAGEIVKDAVLEISIGLDFFRYNYRQPNS